MLCRPQINIKKLHQKKKQAKQAKKSATGGFFHIYIAIFNFSQ